MMNIYPYFKAMHEAEKYFGPLGWEPVSQDSGYFLDLYERHKEFINDLPNMGGFWSIDIDRIKESISERGFNPDMIGNEGVSFVTFLSEVSGWAVESGKDLGGKYSLSKGVEFVFVVDKIVGVKIPLQSGGYAYIIKKELADEHMIMPTTVSQVRESWANFTDITYIGKTIPMEVILPNVTIKEENTLPWLEGAKMGETTKIANTHCGVTISLFNSGVIPTETREVEDSFVIDDDFLLILVKEIPYFWTIVTKEHFG